MEISIKFLRVVIPAFVFVGNCFANEWDLPPSFKVDYVTQGIGYQTAMALAGRGARIIIGDVVDTRESIQNIKEETGNENIVGKFLDLGSLDSVRKFCEEINREESRLDILINNAGIGGIPLQKTKDGLEKHMQINYFGHFLLTHLLIGLLKKNKSRIIFVSSLAAFNGDLNLHNLNEPTVYKNDLKTSFSIYSNSKLCEIIASNVFAEKLKGTSITSNSVYPGCVETPIFDKMDVKNFQVFKRGIVHILLKIAGKNAFEGAQTQINCALSKDLENVSGEYFVDCIKFFQPKLAKDKDFCKAIWKQSEEFVKLKPEEKLENIL